MARGILKTLFATTLAVALLAGQAIPAFAIPAPSEPMTIHSDNFDAGPRAFTISAIPQPPTGAAAWWGLVGGAGRGASTGLWCAGTSASATNYWPTGKYPDYTAGSAKLELPELANYYSSAVSLYYNMPSRGVGDSEALRLWWNEIGDNASQQFTAFPLTGASEWRPMAFDLSSATNDINLSKVAGSMELRFRDTYEPPVAVWNPTTGEYVLVPPVRTGKGPTIDDFKVTGYLYGPVRSLVASSDDVAQEVVLTWAKPAASTASTEDEARSLEYRVWRSPAASNPRVWMDITPDDDPITARTLTDTSVEYNIPYVYEVQAREPGGAGYGEMSPEVLGYVSNGAETPDPAMSLNVTANPTTVVSGGTVTFTYSVKNEGNVALEDVTVSGGILDGIKVVSPSILGPGATGTYVQTKVMTSSATVNATANAAFEGVPLGAVSDPTPPTVTVTPPPPPPFVAPPSRISGSDRAGTAVKVSQQAFPNASSLGSGKAIVVASAYGWADALPASSLAGAVGGPLLLVSRDSIATSVSTEIKRLKGMGVTKAYVVGGDGVVGAGARKAISNLGLTLVRVEGANRYETAAAVLQKTRALRTSGTTGGTAFVATGLNFPDALAASSLAAALRAPIVLTQTASLPSAAATALKSLNPSRIVICGGTSAVSSGVEKQLGALFPGKVERQSGSGRYDTAKAIITRGKTLTGVTSPRGVFLATGSNYPDALAGGVLAGIGVGGQWTPLMLTDPLRLSSQAESFIASNPSLTFGTVLGGTSAVSKGVETAVVELTR